MLLWILTWLQLQSTCHSQAWKSMGSRALLVSASCPQWQNTPGVGAPPTARAGAVSRDIWKFQCPCGWLLPGWVIQRRASCSPQLCYTLTSSIMIHPPSCSGRNSSARKAVLQGMANPSCTECGQRASPCCPRSKPRLPARGTGPAGLAGGVPCGCPCARTAALGGILPAVSCSLERRRPGRVGPGQGGGHQALDTLWGQRGAGGQDGTRGAAEV